MREPSDTASDQAAGSGSGGTVVNAFVEVGGEHNKGPASVTAKVNPALVLQVISHVHATCVGRGREWKGKGGPRSPVPLT